MRPKRKPKTFAENISQKLNRQKQIEAMKKKLLQKAKEYRNQRS